MLNLNKKIVIVDVDGTISKVGESERNLVNELARFPEVVVHAGENHAPNEIANYAYSLAKTFSDFYHNCTVVGSEEEQFRLKLVESFSVVMKNALGLLEINVISKM